MKKNNLILAIFATFLVMACIGYTQQIFFLKTFLHWQCSLEEPTDSCIVKIRSLGHLASEKGDSKEAQYWYQIGANQGDPLAMFHLAWVYEERIYPNFFQNFKKLAKEDKFNPFFFRQLNKKKFSEIRAAEFWYTKSAKLGFAPSMNNLGALKLYFPVNPDIPEEDGVEKAEKAFSWIKESAKAGNPVGQMNLAYAYLTGEGLPQNLAEAEKWMTWIPSSSQNVDLEVPTLKRTRLGELYLPYRIQNRIKNAAQSKEPIIWKFTDILPRETLG
ncbi:MAG: sel1 repeat family protein [Nitrospira sp.]|nr:sel1 repeat family protein [Nitrospira sp.]